MIQIVQLHGTDKKLYELVAPLVMSPEVLKQNYQLPFPDIGRVRVVCCSG